LDALLDEAFADSSTPGAGVTGGGDSAVRRFLGTDGMDVLAGGKVNVGMDGVEAGVAAGVLEYVNGTELWFAMDWSCRVCCWVWWGVRISSNTTIVQYPSLDDRIRH
jgi:hypothetical protein